MDMGLETTGYLDLDIVCPEATRVDIGFGEHLEDMRVRTDVGGRHFTFQWEAPAERCRFTHYFHRVGARYLQLFIYGHEAIVYSAGIRPLNYPFSEESAFHCSDHLHNRIYETAKHTLRCCVHQHYEDSPWREQSLYAFDSRSQMLFGYYAFGEMEQPKASLKLLALSQREDGLLELCAPGRTPVTIPSFSLMFIVALEEYCRYSGDVAFGKELLPTAQKFLMRFKTVCETASFGTSKSPATGISMNGPRCWTQNRFSGRRRFLCQRKHRCSCCTFLQCRECVKSIHIST